jgi:hypothetical protein
VRRALVLLALLLAAPFAAAQAPAEADVKLVRELLAASGGEKQYEQIVDIMLEGMRAGFGQGFRDAMKGKPLDDAKRALAEAVVDRHFAALQREMSALVRRQMPYEKLVSDVYVPLYLRYFSRAELAEATTFFRSATGRKFSEAAPLLMQDASRMLNQRYMEDIARAGGRIMDEHMRRMVEELEKI